MNLQQPVAIVLIGALLLSTGCTSTLPVRVATPAEPTFGQVQPSRAVMAQTPDAERWRFVVEQIDGYAIVARGGTRFPSDKVLHRWRGSFGGSKQVALIGGIAGEWPSLGFFQAQPSCRSDEDRG